MALASLSVLEPAAAVVILGTYCESRVRRDSMEDEPAVGLAVASPAAINEIGSAVAAALVFAVVFEGWSTGPDGSSCRREGERRSEEVEAPTRDLKCVRMGSTPQVWRERDNYLPQELRLKSQCLLWREISRLLVLRVQTFPGLRLLSLFFPHFFRFLLVRQLQIICVPRLKCSCKSLKLRAQVCILYI